ncbi:MAG: thiamine-phosphate kinase [Planctomycetes bacterium]|nr:thiamine-phosphate kinase [Planctomycetota bacterium]
MYKSASDNLNVVYAPAARLDASAEEPMTKHAPRSSDEFEYIRWLRSELPPSGPNLEVGPGDDCAILRVSNDKLALKIDSVIEGKHFVLYDKGVRRPPVLGPASTPEEVGRKAITRCLSDLAAMGATPVSCMVAVTLHTGAPVKLREDLFLGISKTCATYGLSLAGGDTQSWDGPLSITVSMIGSMNGVRPALRAGAAPGDVIAITGSLGGSILGKHLRFEPRIAEGRFLAERGVSAMIDISDGLSGDITRICEESGLRFKVGADIAAEAVPVSKSARRLAKLENQGAERAMHHALHDGEDFELLFIVKPNRWKAIIKEWPFDVPIRALGMMRALKKDEPLVRILRKGEPEALEVLSWVHQL